MRFGHIKTSLTPSHFTEGSVPSQVGEQSHICVLVVSILPLSTIFLLYFGIITTVVFLFFISLVVNYSVYNMYTLLTYEYSVLQDTPLL